MYDHGVKDRNARVYAAVQRIPRGRVATYGQIAALAGLGELARQVGYALYALPDHAAVPWHRVVNARGEISRRSAPGAEPEQRLRLELEGVIFDARGRISMAHYQWRTSRTARLRTRPSALHPVLTGPREAGPHTAAPSRTRQQPRRTSQNP
jgi:methylated-DNA-protein-cysteine methyltransferase-like protein